MKHFESSNAPDIKLCSYWLPKGEEKIVGGEWGSLVTPVQCTCMFPYENSRPSLGEVPKNVKTL